MNNERKSDVSDVSEWDKRGLWMWATAIGSFLKKCDMRDKNLAHHPFTGQADAGKSYVWINGGVPLNRERVFEYFLNVQLSLSVIRGLSLSPAVTEITWWDLVDSTYVLEVHMGYDANRSGGESYFLGPDKFLDPRKFLPFTQYISQAHTVAVMAQSLARSWGLDVVVKDAQLDADGVKAIGIKSDDIA